MANTYHHRHQRKRRQMSDPLPRRREKWLDTTFTKLPLAAPSYIEPQDWLFVDVGPGVRISHMDEVSYEADDHAPDCVHVFRRNCFVMED